MKKLIVCLSILLLFTGCSNSINNNDEDEINYTYDIVSRDVDMSGYDGMNSTKHIFKAITVAELYKCLDNKSSGLFYLGRQNCGTCQICVQYLNQAGEDLDLNIYYIDVYDEQMPIDTKEAINELREYIAPILPLNDEGEREVLTPLVFSIINGEFIDSFIGLGDLKWDDQPTEKQKTKLINRYKEILKPFSK